MKIMSMNNLKYYKESEQMDVASTMAEYESGFIEIIKRGGPVNSDYDFITKVPKDHSHLTVEEQAKIYKFAGPLLNNLDCMIGFAFQKPHGYAGDFEIIDRIYEQRVSTNEVLSKWDVFYHQLHATRAVRNRKQYFKNLVEKTQKRNGCALVLNVGSGPCFDLYEYLSEKKSNKVSFECLDMDKNAIEYGSSICDNYLKNVTFINKNAFRFQPNYQYDLVWSAGMFDYFSDKLFVRLLNRMYGLVKKGGELVIGNFSTNNPSRDVMEVITQWYLHHRNEETLIDLALQAGIDKKNIVVNREETGVNLFLHIEK